MFCVSANAPTGDQNLSASTRMDMAVEKGEALSAVLLLSSIYFIGCFLPFHVSYSQVSFYVLTASEYEVKHLVKSLQCHLAKPDCTYYGVPLGYFLCLLATSFNLLIC